MALFNKTRKHLVMQTSMPIVTKVPSLLRRLAQEILDILPSTANAVVFRSNSGGWGEGGGVWGGTAEGSVESWVAMGGVRASTGGGQSAKRMLAEGCRGEGEHTQCACGHDIFE